MESLVIRAKRKQWRMARRIAEQHTTRWGHQALKWDPNLFFDGPCSQAHRLQARPKKRWTDDIISFCSGCPQHVGKDWMDLALDQDTWEGLEDAFAAGAWSPM